MHSKNSETVESLDLIWGAKAISTLINRPIRQVYWLLETKKLPARKVGNIHVVSRAQLREFFRAKEAADEKTAS